MTPLIRNGETVTVAPVGDHALRVGSIVLARVRGRWYLHKIVAIDGGRFQIANNRGHVNGWASEVVGVLVKRR